MEEKNQTQEEKPRKIFKKRKVTLFKRRKKSEIRPFVKEKKDKKIKKILLWLFLGFLVILSISILLYGIRYLLVKTLFSNSSNILTPQSITGREDENIEKLLSGSGLTVSDFKNSTSSSTITFTANESKVFLDREKNLKGQIETLKAILRQLSIDGKRATVVDLRYNKPIVKF